MTLSAAPKRVEIPMFPDGKRFAFTTSWDDGTLHDRRVVAFFNEHGIKGTFNLNSAFLDGYHGHSDSSHISASEVATLFAGHEVAIHTATHPWLSRLDAAQIAEEVQRDRIALEELVGYPVRGMAYPFGNYNPQVIAILRALGVVYSRTCENQNNPWPAPEPLAWRSTGHMFKPDITAEFLKWYENKGGSGLLYIWGHSYEFDRGNNWPALERIFKPLAGLADVWYVTNIDLYDYEAARQRLVLAANRRSAFNPSAVSVWLSVDGKSVEVPAGKTIALGA